jgi:hypothetical protein
MRRQLSIIAAALAAARQPEPQDKLARLCKPLLYYPGSTTGRGKMPFRITSSIRHEGDRVSVLAQSDSSSAEFAELTVLFSFAPAWDFHENVDALIREEAKKVLRKAADEI